VQWRYLHAGAADKEQQQNTKLNFAISLRRSKDYNNKSPRERYF
jgi:hypothetical protein